jgi:ABC-type microcin C transport system duplicated ATPase subunit YejF
MQPACLDATPPLREVGPATRWPVSWRRQADEHATAAGQEPGQALPHPGGLLQRVVDQVHAVDGVSFDLMPGETLGVVGESGCGKSTTGRCILRLIEPTAGEVIWFNGQNVTQAGKAELRALARDMQIIFQDPYASLNPRMTVGAIIGEALTIHKLAPNAKAYDDRIVELLETVGLAPTTCGVIRTSSPAASASASASHARWP